MTAEVRPPLDEAQPLPAPAHDPAAPTWWRHPGLDVVDDRLTVAGADLEELARGLGTPLFVYDLARPIENVRRLQAALARAGVPYLVRYALKAGPEPRILRILRDLGEPGSLDSVGIDASSPARCCMPSRTAGSPRRSPTPARTSPSATSMSSSPTRSASTSTP